MEIITKDGKVYKFEFAHYGEKRELNATDEELIVADEIVKILPPADDYDIVRKSDNYITLTMSGLDLARIKFTEKAKWVNICAVDLGKVKRRIEKPEDVQQFKDDFKKSYDFIIMCR